MIKLSNEEMPCHLPNCADCGTKKRGTGWRKEDLSEQQTSALAPVCHVTNQQHVSNALVPVIKTDSDAWDISKFRVKP
jgi:hypothetical protein